MNNSRQSMKGLDRWVWVPFMVASVFFYYQWKPGCCEWLALWSSGFFFLAMFSLRYPLRFGPPLIERVAPKLESTRWRDISGLLGWTLLIAGVVWRYVE